MEKQAVRHICPKCKQKAAIKYGKQNGVQKYRCYACRKLVYDKRPKLSAKDKDFLIKLLNLIYIKQDKYIDIKEILNVINKNPQEIKDIDTSIFEFKNLVENEPIKTSNPKILFCNENGKLVMYRFNHKFIKKHDDYCSFQIIHNAEKQD